MEALGKPQKRLQKSLYFLFIWGNSRWQKGGANFFSTRFWRKSTTSRIPAAGVNSRETI